MTFYTFANATTSIPLANLDANFATPITLGNTAVTINGTFSSIGNLTLNNATIASGNSTVTKETVTTITSPAATNLTIQSAGTTAMTIDTSQNVGIGTASPAGKLSVAASNNGILISGTAGNSTSLYIAGNGTSAGSTSFDLYQDSSSNAVVYQRANGPLIFGTNSAERMRIDSSGNVGIGTTSPGYKLNVSTASATNGIGIRIDNSGSTGAGIQMFNGYDDFEITMPTTTGGMRFIASGTNERMRIDSSGNLLVGTTTSAQKLTVNGNIAATASSAAFIGGTSTDVCYLKNSDGTSYVQLDGSSKTGDPNVIYIVANTGGVYLAKGGTSWTAVSDERFKENLVPITNAASKVASLRAVTGNYIDDETKQSKSFLIAQDVQKVLPEAVDMTNASKLGLSYTDVIPLLVAALQELKAEFDAYKASHP